LRRLLPLLALGLLARPSPSSGAAAESRRSVAVLEYRAGAGGAPDLGARLAERLRRTAALTVVDPQEARRRNPRVDGQLARCAGAPDCIAHLGRGLDVDEVLLAGVSQLGDLVVSLQRVDAASARVEAQHSAVLDSGGGALSDERLDAWLRQLYPPDTFKRYGAIAITANVDGAIVTLDDQERGRTPLDGKIKVPAPHGYRVGLRKPGYLPFAARIDVVPDASVEVRAELSPESAPLPWYKRWWVWGIVGGVAAGAAIGTAVYLTRPDELHDSGYLILPSH